MGIPNNGGFRMENPIYKWMKTRGTPISGNHHLEHDFCNHIRQWFDDFDVISH